MLDTRTTKGRNHVTGHGWFTDVCFAHNSAASAGSLMVSVPKPFG